MKCLFFGHHPGPVRFFKEALIPQNPDFEFFPINVHVSKLPETLNCALAILDVTRLDSNNIPILYNLIEKLRKEKIKLLALIPENEIRLRYRLMKLGINDYLKIPFDKLDVEVRVCNLLHHQKIEKVCDSESIESGNILQDLTVFQDVLESLDFPYGSKTFSATLPAYLKTIHAYLNLQHLFYFVPVDENTVELVHSVYEYQLEEKLRIPINHLPVLTKAVRWNESTILNTINPNNPLYIFLKSYLNIDINAFMVLPIVYNSHTVGLILAVKTDKRKFLDFHFWFLKFVAKILELHFKVCEIPEELPSEKLLSPKNHNQPFLQNILNSLNFGIMVLDKGKKIKFVNKTAAEIFNLDIYQYEYPQLEKIVGKKNMKNIFTSSEERSGIYERPEIELNSRNGSNIFIGFSVTNVEDSLNGAGGYIISLKDITYAKEHLEEIQRMDKLASLGVMASGIAHEIRNPLAGIKAIAQTFEEEFSDEDPKKEYVKRILKQVNRLDGMLKTLFSYARPQHPNRQYHHSEGILQDVLSILNQKIQKSNIKLTQSFGSNIPPVYIDSSQIQQVLFNLVLNSIEAIHSDGEIHIRIEFYEKEPQRFQGKQFSKRIIENPYCLISISDNGCGISQEDLQQIFNPFFTRKNFGTGLGLSIVYQMVQENDGVIYYESELSKGTDCYLFLPAFESSTQPVAETSK